MQDSEVDIIAGEAGYYIEAGAKNSALIGNYSATVTVDDSSSSTSFDQPYPGHKIIYLGGEAEAMCSATANLADDVIIITTAFASAFSQAFK